MGGGPSTFETSPPLLKEPPYPLYAYVSNPGRQFVVVFDKPLEAAVLDTANWFAVQGLNDYNVTAAASSHSEVILDVALAGGFTPPEGVDYYASPPDLYGENGLPVAAFTRVPFA